MSLIACTDPCIYQKDGYCSLSRAASMDRPGERCVNYVPIRPEGSQERGQSLPDVGHPDDL